MTYTEFKRMHIDLGALGAEGGRNAVRYTCTPKGAKIFGWAGVDGIHFCTIKGFGETIFSVSPMNPGQDCVQPLARDMGDFLRLLLACGDTAALEQAWMWTEAQFEEYLREYPPTEDQRAVMREIEEKCGLAPMEEPWRYLKKVRAETDCSGLRFEKEYEELLHPAEQKSQEWTVYFENGFGGKKPRHRPGKETRLDKAFCWAGEEWLAPAVYSCSEGLVVDLLKKVPEERLRRFREKWGMDENSELCRELPPAEQDAMEAENPMEERFRAEVTVNGRRLQQSTGYGVCWVPGLPESARWDGETEQVVAHYGLERDCGWVIWRVCCPWNGGKLKPETVELTMTAEKEAVDGGTFTAEPGKTVPLTDPRTGLTHTLRVLSLTPETMDRSLLPPVGMEFPTEYVEMQYTLEPPLPVGDFVLVDAAPGDEARACRVENGIMAQESACCIGIIGGADGPTAVFVSGKGDEAGEDVRAAYSSLHYKPVETVTWRARFMARPKEAVTVTLM